MKDENKTKDELIKELKGLRQRVIELKESEIECKQAEERINHLNLVLLSIRNVNQLITREKDRDMLLQGACNNLVENRGYFNVWFVIFNKLEGIIATAEAGLGKDFLLMIERLKSGKLTICGQRALKQSNVVVIKDPLSTCIDCPLSADYAGRGAMTVRLGYEEKIYGLLTASIPRYFTEDEEEQSLFKEVANDIAFAIHSIELEGEQKLEEEALKESEEKYRLLVENANDAIFIAQNEIIKFPNPKTEELTGYSAEELVKIPFINHIHPEDRDMVLNRQKRRLKGEKLPSTYSFRIINRAGEELWVQLNVVLTKWEECPATLNFLRDITPQKRLETQLIQSQKIEAIGTLAGGIAHDFNNLLMGIQGNASLMLLDIDSSHPYYEKLENIEHCVQSGAELTRQLLGFARGGKYEVKPINFNELIKKTSMMFGRTKKEIKIYSKYQKYIWTVEADSEQIEHVLLNLYVNAWQAMPEGGELYLQSENVTLLDEEYVRPFNAEPGRYVKISITDTGEGMDEETRKRVFDPFFTTRDMGRGTGLGLASAYGIIRNHGGIINIYSEKGEGTTFNIYLPASEKEVIEEKRLHEEVVKGTETFLLVDDEDMVINVGSKMLKEMGYKVFTARNGKEAIRLYEENKKGIDMVILDMIMPDIGGGEAYDKLKRINLGIKVLLSSGYSIDGQAKKILERGCDGFIQKPFNMKQLSQKIRIILDKRHPDGE